MEINGKPVELSEVIPLRVADWRKLEGFGITLDALQNGEVEQLARFAYYVTHKAEPMITREDIDGLTLPELSAIIGDCLAGSGGEAVVADPG